MLATLAFALCSSAAFAQQAAPFAITEEDLKPAAAPFAVTAEDAEIAAGRTITFSGTESAGDAAITNNEADVVKFNDGSTAADATIVNNSGGATRFNDQSSGGSGLFTNNSDATLDFNDQSSAADANITNNGGGAIGFSGTADAGTATIRNNGSISFADDSSAAAANITSNAGATVDFSGHADAGTAGITNNGALTFRDESSAGGLITNNQGATTVFSGSSTAATAAFKNNGDLGFTGSSRAGSASIVNNLTGVTRFSGDSAADAAFIANSGGLEFTEDSAGGTAEIVNNKTGTISLSGNATLGAAQVNNAGIVSFDGRSTAGSATIVTGPAGRVYFDGESSGGAAVLETNVGGIVDFSGVTDGAVEVGSIQGPGTYFLGGVAITVGANNISTTVDGAIADGGRGGGSGGSLIKVGAGMLTLSGANTYTGSTTVRQGVLQAGAESALASNSAFIVDTGATLDLAAFDQTIGSLAGGGAVDLATARLTVGGDDSDTDYAGVMIGTGGLTKTGAGRMELSGASAYSGDTVVEGGELYVSGSIAGSAVGVGVDATLSGTGAVGATNVSGTLLRENDGGTLTIAGDLSIGPGATYEITLEDQASDAALVAVAGTAMIGGSRLVVSPTGGFTVVGRSYTLLQASSVEGQFVVAESEMPFLESDLSYAAQTVELTITRNAASFSSVADTRNQAAVGDAVEALGDGALYDAVVVSADAGAARQAFDALSGEIHPTLANRLLGDQLMLREALLAQAYESAATKGLDHGYRIWLQPLASAVDAKSDGNAAGYDWRGTGVVAGADTDIGDGWIVGIAGSYLRSDLELDARSSDATTDATSVALYAARRGPDWRARLGATYGWQSVATVRSIAFGDFADYAEADYDANAFQLFGEAGYPLVIGNGEFEPFLGLGYARIDTDAFTESGGEAALAVAESSIGGMTATLGVRANGQYQIGDTASLRLAGVVGWQYASLDTKGGALAFAGGAPFLVGGIPIDGNAMLLGASAELVLGRTSLGIGYDGMIGDLSSQHTIRGLFRVTF